MARASLCRPQNTVSQRAAMAIQRVSARARAQRASSFLTAAQKRSLKLIRMNSDTLFNRRHHDESQTCVSDGSSSQFTNSTIEVPQTGDEARSKVESGPLPLNDVDAALEQIADVFADSKADSDGVVRRLHALDNLTAHHQTEHPQRRLSLAVSPSSGSSQATKNGV